MPAALIRPIVNADSRDRLSEAVAHLDVGRGYLSAESMSLVVTGVGHDIEPEIKEATAQLPAA